MSITIKKKSELKESLTKKKEELASKITNALEKLAEKKRAINQNLQELESQLSTETIANVDKGVKKTGGKFSEIAKKREERDNEIRRKKAEISRLEEKERSFQDIHKNQQKLVEEELDRLQKGDPGSNATPEEIQRYQDIIDVIDAIPSTPDNIAKFDFGISPGNTARRRAFWERKDEDLPINRTGKPWTRKPIKPDPLPRDPVNKDPNKDIDPDKDPKNPTTLNSPTNAWTYFFNQDDVVKFSNEKPVTLASIPQVTPEQFRQHFEQLEHKIVTFKGKDEQQIFGVTKDPSVKDSYFVGKYGATDEKSQKAVEFKYVEAKDSDPDNPKPGKIDIVLHDPAMKDDSLFMMVVAAKDTLEKMGRQEFHITNCEDKPEIALKLYLIGKSLGLDPKFKDGLGLGKDTETYKSIVNPNPPVSLRIDGEMKTLAEVYELAEHAKDTEQILKLIKGLERKGVSADLTATKGPAAPTAPTVKGIAPGGAMGGASDEALRDAKSRLKPVRK